MHAKNTILSAVPLGLKQGTDACSRHWSAGLLSNVPTEHEVLSRRDI